MQNPSGEYVFMAARSAPDEEAARLRTQNRYLNKQLGLFPQGLNLETCHDFLDIACGSGDWVIEVAKYLRASHPKLRVVGIDKNPYMIQVAVETAVAFGHNRESLANVAFRVMDATTPLDFPDASFDYIRVCLGSSFLPAQGWSHVLSECTRLLRKGGILVLIDAELPITTGAACEKLAQLITHAYTLTGKSISPGGRTIGATAHLFSLLNIFGYHNIKTSATAINLFPGSDGQNLMAQSLCVAFKMIEPFLVDFCQVTTSDAFATLYEQASAEIKSSSFGGFMYVLSAWGYRPNLHS
jgi:ubiquinone/menaquinone biosynthesis C-methylase UbiE